MVEKLNLICLPFAGGNRYSYREFAKEAKPLMNIITLEYPGRGARIKEDLVTDINNLVKDLYNQIKDLLADANDYAIYGHSMGGLAAYLLCLKILSNKQKAPLHLFISGTMGPASASRKEKKRHLLEKDEFITEIRELGGMPEEILQNEELLNYLEPILRADFMVSETYQYIASDPLNIPITVITGTEEEMEDEDIKLWQQETNHHVDFRKMPGKHFFIFDHTQHILKTILRKTSKHTNAY